MAPTITCLCALARSVSTTNQCTFSQFLANFHLFIVLIKFKTFKFHLFQVNTETRIARRKTWNIKRKRYNKRKLIVATHASSSRIHRSPILSQWRACHDCATKWHSHLIPIPVAAYCYWFSVAPFPNGYRFIGTAVDTVCGRQEESPAPNKLRRSASNANSRFCWSVVFLSEFENWKRQLVPRVSGIAACVHQARADFMPPNQLHCIKHWFEVHFCVCRIII